MKTKQRYLFVTFVTSILLLCFAHSAIALEIWEYESGTSMYRIQYEDGTYGNIDINTTETVFDDWPETWTVEVLPTFEIYSESMLNGIQIGAVYESEALVTPSSASINPSYTMYTSYTYSRGVDDVGDFNTYREVTNTVPLIRFYVNLSSKDVMNGVQEMWYRSPVKWQDNFDIDPFYNYPLYFLNIYDSSDTLVFASNADLVEDNRTFFKLNFKLYSGERYKFVEGVCTDDDDPLSSLTVFFSQYQDIGYDLELDSYVFPLTPDAKKYEGLEFSWSLVCQVGIGLAGTEKLLCLSQVEQAAPSANVSVLLITQDLYGANDDVDYINISIPLRMTKPTDIRVRVHTYSGSDESISSYYFFNATTGILTGTLPITDPNATEANSYKLYIEFYNLSSVDHYLTYTMIPSTCYHEVIASFEVFGMYYFQLIHRPHFAVHVELEEGIIVEPFQDRAIRYDTILLGIGEIALGIILFAIGLFVAPFGGVALMVVGVGLVASGAYTCYQGYIGIDPGSSILPTVLNGLISGTIQLAKTIYSGIAWVAENLWNAIVWVAEQLQNLGAGLMIFFEMLVDFGYFIAFMLVVWVWAKFLKIMDGIVSGDIDKALSTVSTVYSKGTKQLQKGAKTVLKFKGR